MGIHDKHYPSKKKKKKDSSNHPVEIYEVTWQIENFLLFFEVDLKYLVNEYFLYLIPSSSEKNLTWFWKRLKLS